MTCNFPPTLRDLLKLQNTLYQLEVLARADRLLRNKTGRHYGGRLTLLERKALTIGIRD